MADTLVLGTSVERRESSSLSGSTIFRKLSMIDEIEIQQWWKPGGGMMYNTECLDPDHHMHPYNQALAQGVRPEDFGIQNPYAAEFNDKSREELIEEVIDLRKQVLAYAKAGF